MTLREYLKTAQISQSQFADRIGVSRQAVVRYLGGRIPDSEVLRRIIAETGGDVTANDFFGLAA